MAKTHGKSSEFAGRNETGERDKKKEREGRIEEKIERETPLVGIRHAFLTPQVMPFLGKGRRQCSFRDWGNFSNYPVLKWWRAIFFFFKRMPLEFEVCSKGAPD